ncbi:MAG: IS1634 family transposase [Isosphaeraceae bacterium]
MDNSLQLTHERVDDVPLLLGFLIKLGLPQILDRHLPAHPLHQGLSNGWLIAVWITYILSQADHRKCHVRDWATGLHHTLESVTGQSFRPVDFTDDRLTLVLQRLSDPTVWGLLEADLWQSTCDVYELPVERIRLDSTTSYGYHTVTEGGLMQLGHSKDHRPDLPQLKLMAAAAEPTGMLVASDVHPGDAADDPLYLPLIRRVRELLGRTGLLYTGDCKMAALETRGEIDAHGDFYLTPLPMTGETQKQFEAWVDAAINGPKREELVNIRMGDDLVGRGYEFERIQTILCGSTEHAWTERVLIVRSEPSAQSQAMALERRLAKAEVAIRGLTPPPGRGKPQYTTGWELERAVAVVLAEYDVEGLLEVNWTREEICQTRYVGRGRGGPNRPTKTEWTIRYQITEVRCNTQAIQDRFARMGWRALVTNVPAQRLTLVEAVLAYRGGWCVERDFHQLKDQPLGISPLFVRRDDQVVGLTRPLTLALRVLTLFEVLVRRGQKQAGEKLKGLYSGQASRTTEAPTAVRVLKAIAKAEITLTRAETEDGSRWHLTPLPELLRRVLAYLGLQETVYTRLVMNSS